MINFQPLNDNALIKLDSTDEETTSGGIIIPDSARGKEDEGEVVAVPPGAGEEVAVGDRVMFRSNATTEITQGDERYLIVPFKDIIGKYVEVDSI